MDESAGIEPEYHHKNNRVYCWKGLRFSARQDLEGFSRFTEYGIGGVVPLELLTPEVRSKYQAKPAEKAKRVKKDDTKSTNQAEEESQTATATQMDVDGTKVDTDTATPPLDADAAIAAETNLQSGTPTREDNQKHSSDTEVVQDGQIEAEAEVEAVAVADAETEAEAEAEVEGEIETETESGMIDGEMDAGADLEAVV